jgi:Protein of unknown function (DUF3261)
MSRVIVLLLLLASCAAPREPADTAMIAPDVRFTVPPPATLGQTLTVHQQVVAHYRDQDFGFEAELAITPMGLDLVALDGFGRRAFTIAWHGVAPTIETAPWLPVTLRPANMLADIALIYWPQAVVAHAVAAAGGVLAVTDTSRSVSVGGREIVHVDYAGGNGWTGTARYRNLAFGYRLDIQSVRIDP